MAKKSFLSVTFFFRFLYPASSKDALEILDKALQFNPVKRINLEELINQN